MKNSWHDAYKEIRDFTSSHPAVEVAVDTLSIPESLRAEFYRLFDNVRMRFISDNYAASLNEANRVISKHEEVKKDVVLGLRLSEIKVKSSLADFLDDPLSQITRTLYNPLLDLIKGKLDLTAFEEMTKKNIDATFYKFFRDSYESWVTLSILKLAAPDEVYCVPVPEQSADVCVSDNVIGPGIREELLLPPMLANRVSFDLTPYCPYIVPKTIVHSRRLNLYLSLIQDFHEASQRAYNVSDKREWLEVAEVLNRFGQGRLWPDIAIYVGDQAEELSLVADTYRFARPDILISIMQREDWNDAGRIELAKRRHDAFKPVIGSFVICSAPPVDSV